MGVVVVTAFVRKAVVIAAGGLEACVVKFMIKAGVVVEVAVVVEVVVIGFMLVVVGVVSMRNKIH